MSRLSIKAIELRHANKFVQRHHRHSPTVTGHRWSSACWDGDRLCGVVIVGRPVARRIDQASTVEVLRMCSDGTPHVCSLLYASAARAAKAIGYDKIITYTLDTEPGTSLMAAGWIVDGSVAAASGQGWKNRAGRVLPLLADQDPKKRPECAKVRWAKQLR